jgi:hypothetical protein
MPLSSVSRTICLPMAARLDVGVFDVLLTRILLSAPIWRVKNGKGPFSLPLQHHSQIQFVAAGWLKNEAPIALRHALSSALPFRIQFGI